MSNDTNNTDNTVENKLAPIVNIALINHIDVADMIKNEVKEGNVNPIEVMLALKKLHKIVELTTDSSKGDPEVRKIFLEATEKALDGGKSVDMFGANLRVQNTGITYDFSVCNDSVLNELIKIRDIVEASIKQRQDEIKVLLPVEDNKKLGIRTRTIIQTGVPVLTYSEDEFEEVLSPPLKKSGTSVIVTFKKK